MVSLRGVLVNILDCDIVISKSELQLRYYVHLAKVWTPLLTTARGLYNGFGIKYPTKVDISLNKRTVAYQVFFFLILNFVKFLCKNFSLDLGPKIAENISEMNDTKEIF